MAKPLSQLTISIDPGPGADDEDRAALAQQLREDLLERDVDAVDQVRSGAAPAGARGDPAVLATLAVTLGPIALTELMKALQTWLSRHERASVTVESGGEKIVVTGSPSKEQQQVIETFVSHHKA